jgi:hypothetical protein
MLIRVANNRPTIIMNEVMMPSTQTHEIVEVCGAIMAPPLDVMTFDTPGVLAGRKAAAIIASFE